MRAPDEHVVDMKDMNVFNSGFLKKTCDLQDSIFTYFRGEATKSN